MTKTTLRWLFAGAVAAILATSGVARADVTGACSGQGDDPGCQNVQDGDNSSDVTQGGSTGSGDAVGGQVTGLVSSGDTSVDAKNRSEDVDVESGPAAATNTLSSITGLTKTDGFTSVGPVANDVTDTNAFNIQDGDNDSSLTQSASASSGDGVGGQVIGAVTSAGGSADIVADNTSEDVDINTGDADATNDAGVYTGLAVSEGSLDVGSADVSGVLADNVQDGDNDLSVDQSTDAASGDGVGGQVIGSVAAGDTSIDAKNRSEDADVQTGESVADNSAAAVVGLAGTDDNIEVRADDVEDVDEANNAQDGDNSADIAQTATSSSGDGVAGSVIGSVTSAGGSADIVADNASEDVDADTGNADAGNDLGAYVGLASTESSLFVFGSDVSGIPEVENVQDGDNDLSADQSTDATTGDAVGGQVIGSVAAGDTSIDAKNRSTDDDVTTGNADANSASSAVVGLAFSESESVNVSDITDVDGVNLKDGDNEATIDQTASAFSGDAVAGQVAGAVTSGGGSADAVFDNASEDVDATSGEGTFSNDQDLFVGLGFADSELIVG